MSRFTRILTLAVAAAALVVQMAVPSLAEERDHFSESSTVTVSVADGNLRGILMEGEQDATNVTCSLPNWSAVNQQAVDVPGVTFVYGRDIAEGTLTCNNTDALTGGVPTAYDTFLTVEILAYDPFISDYVSVDKRTCYGTSAASQNATPCVMTHDYLDRDDDRQLYYRKATFTGGVIVNGVPEVRTYREFGPLSPSYLLVDSTV
jgi:hypothetical protein